MSTLRLIQLVVALQEKPRTNTELQDLCGFTRQSVGLTLNVMRDAGYVDVMGWGDKTAAQGAAPTLWGWK